MGEGEHVPVIAQVLEPSLDRREHAHFVIEPGQLFGSCALQGMQIAKQQIVNRRDDKGRLLLPGLTFLCLCGCVHETPRSSGKTNVRNCCFLVSHKICQIDKGSYNSL